MDVYFAPRAQADLEEITDYIAEDNPSRARSFASEINERCLQLAEMPRAFPLISRYRRRGYRRRAFGSYLII